MKNYKDLLSEILLLGENRGDRTGVGTISIFGSKLTFDLSKGFPAVTTKTLAWKPVVSELLWFLSGSTNVNDLREILHGSRTKGKTIWDANYEKQGKALGYTGGELGPVYGAQFHLANQLTELIEGIKKNPTSRRHVLSLWNPEQLEAMALPPCHGIHIQFNITNSGKLDCMFTMRSVDVFLGLPFNLASYALLTHILASICGLDVGTLTYIGGDTHIYQNHLDQCALLLSREPKPLPTLEFPKIHSILELPTLAEFKLVNYAPHPSIPAPMAV